MGETMKTHDDLAGLVNRLREPWFTNGCAQYQREAADAIEALAAENARLRGALASNAENIIAEMMKSGGLMLALATGYDGEDAAQRGEPNPHLILADDHDAEEEWLSERIECARAGLDAIRAALAATTPTPTPVDGSAAGETDSKGDQG